MDLWMIILLAVILIIAFVAVFGRSAFGANARDEKALPRDDAQRDFSDDPGKPGR
jgi:hypothetical protein